MSRKPSMTLVIITALLLAGYLGLVGWAWLSPSTDPQGGMAVGFLVLATLFFLGLAGLLWYGAARQRAGCVWVVFGICALPSLSLSAGDLSPGALAAARIMRPLQRTERGR